MEKLNKVLTTRVSETIKTEMQELIKNNNFRNESEFIRIAILLLSNSLKDDNYGY